MTAKLTPKAHEKPGGKRRKAPPGAPEHPAETLPVLVPRPDGRGALLSGGLPGNRGGKGALPSVTRQAYHEDFVASRPIVERIAQGEVVRRMEVELRDIAPLLSCPSCNGEGLTVAAGHGTQTVVVRASASPKDIIAAIDLQGKYSIGTRSEIDVVSRDVKDRLGRQWDVIEEELPADVAERLMSRLTSEVWV